MLSVDGVGAYDHISRRCMLLPVAALCYGSPSMYVFYDEEGIENEVQDDGRQGRAAFVTTSRCRSIGSGESERGLRGSPLPLCLYCSKASSVLSRALQRFCHCQPAYWCRAQFCCRSVGQDARPTIRYAWRQAFRSLPLRNTKTCNFALWKGVTVFLDSSHNLPF